MQVLPLLKAALAPTQPAPVLHKTLHLFIELIRSEEIARLREVDLQNQAIADGTQARESVRPCSCRKVVSRPVRVALQASNKHCETAGWCCAEDRHVIGQLLNRQRTASACARSCNLFRPTCSALSAASWPVRSRRPWQPNWPSNLTPRLVCPPTALAKLRTQRCRCGRKPYLRALLPEGLSHQRSS